MAVYECKVTDKKNKTRQVGRMEIKNKTADKADLYFYGDIVNDTWSSYYYDEDKCPQDIMDFLAELDGTKEIDVYVNSGGGSVHGGLAIYHQLKRYAGHKRAIVDGLAASIASIIPFACDEVVIYDSSHLMVHKPWCEAYGNADDLRTQADALDSCQAAIVNIYMENAKDGIEREYIEDLVNKETWLTGQQAKEIFDIEVEDHGEVFASVSNYYDSYRNKPEKIGVQQNSAEEAQNLEKEKLQTELDLLSM